MCTFMPECEYLCLCTPSSRQLQQAQSQARSVLSPGGCGQWSRGRATCAASLLVNRSAPMLRVTSCSSHGQIYGSLDLWIDYVAMKNALLTVLKADAHYLPASNTSGNPVGIFWQSQRFPYGPLRDYFVRIFFHTGPVVVHMGSELWKPGVFFHCTAVT